MLEILGKSKIRQKIILTFVYNRGKEFYLSEIARMVKTSAGTTQRELNRLMSQDLITFRKRGNLNIYRLNESYTLLDEIESIVRKTIGIEAQLADELRPSHFSGCDVFRGACCWAAIQTSLIGIGVPGFWAIYRNTEFNELTDVMG